LRRFDASPRRATPEGHKTSISCTTTRKESRLLPIRPLSARVAQQCHRITYADPRNSVRKRYARPRRRGPPAKSCSRRSLAGNRRFPRCWTGPRLTPSSARPRSPSCSKACRLRPGQSRRTAQANRDRPIPSRRRPRRPPTPGAERRAEIAGPRHRLRGPCAMVNHRRGTTLIIL
jgi:hypothetical protein